MMSSSDTRMSKNNSLVTVPTSATSTLLTLNSSSRWYKTDVKSLRTPYRGLAALPLEQQCWALRFGANEVPIIAYRRRGRKAKMRAVPAGLLNWGADQPGPREKAKAWYGVSLEAVITKQEVDSQSWFHFLIILWKAFLASGLISTTTVRKWLSFSTLQS